MRTQLVRPLATALVALSLSACAGSATPAATGTPAASSSTGAIPSAPSLTADPAPSASSVSASLPPASLSLAFGGEVTGVGSSPLISCDSPSLGGLIISIYGTTTTTDVSTTITLSAGQVVVTLDAGSGATYVSRSFSGTGVTGFDATKGAQLDSQLVEGASSSKPGKLPAISSIKGSVDCGNQMPGTSTLTLSGTVPEGAVTGPIDPIRVDCNPNSTPVRVHALGVIKIGATPTMIVFQATATGFTAYLAPTATTKQHFYMTTDPAAATISPTGAHVSGSAAETGTANTLQLNGDLVCGVTNP